MKKIVKCPECGTHIEVLGKPGETVILNCPNCNVRGKYTFKSKTPEEKISYDGPMIKVQNLSKSYKKVKAVDNVSFQVNKGEIFGFLGPNGAGKTTTIRSLLGLLKLDKGEAYIFGRNIKKNIVEIRRNVGYIPGELALYEHLTGRQFIDYFRSLRNTTLPLLNELFEIFDLPLDRKIKTYSRGMKQKMGIIQAFMDDPDIVIMDEPTIGLDPLLQEKFYRFLKKEKEKGRTMFFSSHILSEVEKICDRVAIIRSGKLVALESIDNLKDKRGKKIRVKIEENPEELLSMKNAKEDDGWIEFVTEDDIDILIKKLAKYTVKDIEINEFSLEDIFMRYYEEGGEN